MYMYVYIYIYIYIYEEMVDFGKSDKMIKIREKLMNQTLTIGLVVIFPSLNKGRNITAKPL